MALVALLVNDARALESTKTSKAPTLTTDERDVICGRLLTRLSGIDAVCVAARTKDLDRAKSLMREYSDDLRVLADLGWNDDREKSYELSTPPGVLRSVLGRLEGLVDIQDADEAEKRAEVREAETQNRLLAGACERVLTELGGSHSGAR